MTMERLAALVFEYPGMWQATHVVMAKRVKVRLDPLDLETEVCGLPVIVCDWLRPGSVLLVEGNMKRVGEILL